MNFGSELFTNIHIVELIELLFFKGRSEYIKKLTRVTFFPPFHVNIAFMKRNIYLSSFFCNLFYLSLQRRGCPLSQCPGQKKWRSTCKVCKWRTQRISTTKTQASHGEPLYRGALVKFWMVYLSEIVEGLSEFNYIFLFLSPGVQSNRWGLPQNCWR